MRLPDSSCGEMVVPRCDVRRCLAGLFLFLFAGLSACAPTFAPSMDGGVTPQVSNDAIVARDGVRLPLRRWDAEGGQEPNKPRAVIVALHGMSDYSNAFDMPGKVWAKLGITTLAYDQRGFGLSDRPGLWAGADAMRADLNDAIAAARVRYPGVPVFALGGISQANARSCVEAGARGLAGIRLFQETPDLNQLCNYLRSL